MAIRHRQTKNRNSARRTTWAGNLVAKVSLMLVLSLVLAACGDAEQATTGQQSQASPTTQTLAASPTSAVTPTTEATATPQPTTTPTLAPHLFQNPVLDRDFPDPDILKVGDTYYLYATQPTPPSMNVQMAKSTDLVNWQVLADALPTLPGWSAEGHTWAPEVTTTGEGQYVMYFTARHTESGRQCIGAATSSSPEQAFEPHGEQPLICQVEQGGSIDAAAFVDDDGTRYVLWKSDGNCCYKDTWIYIQQVSADGLTLQGEPAQLIKQEKVWEGSLVEGPTLWKHEGKYYLFYSANDYKSDRYAVGYAVADNILGPYTKAEEPILVTDYASGGAFGPGGQDVVLDNDGETWLVYHSWDPTVTYRGVQIDELVWEQGVPVVKGPDKQPQEKP